MNVVERCFECIGRIDVAIVPGAFLPEAKTELSWPFPNSQLLQQASTGLLEKLPDFFREGLFDSGKIATDIWLGRGRIDEQVNVFGHIDKRNQTEGHLFAGILHRGRQATPPVVVRQQRHAMIAREGQLVKVTGLVVVPNSLAMGLTGSHGDDCSISEGVAGSASAGVALPIHYPSDVRPSDEGTRLPRQFTTQHWQSQWHPGLDAQHYRSQCHPP